MELVKGREVTVSFDASRCVHARNRVLSLPEVFVPNVQGSGFIPMRRGRMGCWLWG